MNTSLQSMSRNPIDAVRNGFQNLLQMALTIALAMAALLSAPVAFAQSSGLVAAYSFDEGAGTTAADKSGNGNNGTLVNGATWSTTSKFGAAASFDGTNDRIDVADSNSLDLTSGMTLEAWVRPTANSSYRTVVLKEVSGELAYSLYAADSDHGARPSGWIRIASASHYADGTNTLPLNVYSHIAVTYNGSALVFYVNGVATQEHGRHGQHSDLFAAAADRRQHDLGRIFPGPDRRGARVQPRALAVRNSNRHGDADAAAARRTRPAPTVSLTAPANGATVSGTATVSANAADNVGVVGVQFKVDGANVGARGHDCAVLRFSGTPTALATEAIRSRRWRATRRATSTTSAVRDRHREQPPTTQAPTVSLTAPASGATVSGTTTVSADRGGQRRRRRRAVQARRRRRSAPKTPRRRTRSRGIRRRRRNGTPSADGRRARRGRQQRDVGRAYRDRQQRWQPTRRRRRCR